MQRNYRMWRSIIFCSFVLFFSSCSDDGKYEPLDIINGQADVQQINAEKNFTNPGKVFGNVKDKITTETISGVQITAKRTTSTEIYTTKTKSDGSYVLYVEGGKEYTIYAEKEGFNKQYHYEDRYTDTIAYIGSYDASIYFSLEKYDPTPIITPKYLTTKYLSNSLKDISFNGTHITGHNDYNLYRYNTEGIQVRASSFYSYRDYHGCSDTLLYWVSSNYKSIDKVGQNGGETIETIYAQIPTSTLTGVDVFSNSIYLLSTNKIYKLNTKGELLMTIDLSKKLSNLNLKGITHKNNFIYVLNEKYGYSNTYSKNYILYKINSSTGEIVGKGEFPQQFEDQSLLGLACDGSNFWTITAESYYYQNLIKFSIIE